MEYAYGRSDHRLEDKAWGPDYHDAVMEAGKQAGILKQIFFIFTIMQNLPEKLAIILSPPFELVLRIQRVRLLASRSRSKVELIRFKSKLKRRSPTSKSSPVTPIKTCLTPLCSTRSSPAISQNQIRA